MKNRPHISSLDVARESLKQDRVVIETDRNRTKRVKAARKASVERSSAPGASLSDQMDIASYSFVYGANGETFNVTVYARSPWWASDNEDGLSVMVKDATTCGYIHLPARFADLPREVRAVAKDIRAALTYGETRADREREARSKRRDARFEQGLRERHPHWFNPDGTRKQGVT